MGGIGKHPKGLYLLFATEMWERFSYYGMRAILILYLTASLVDGGLGFSDSDASLLYGIFTGLVYFTPLIGGYIADRYLGHHRSIILGAVIMILGEFALASDASSAMVYTGLSLLIIGNGFFKPNMSVMVGDLYEPDDPRRDGAFTIFYMGINIGAFFSPLVVGAFSVRYGYRCGFLVAGIGLVLGLLFYLMLQRRLLGPDTATVRKSESSDPVFALSGEEKDRTWLIIILTLFAVVFFAGYEQAGCSMTLYTDKFIDRSIGDFVIPTEWFLSINPLLIVILAPLMSMIWRLMGSREPSIPVKMGVGMVLLGLGFVSLLGAVAQRGGDSDDIAIKANMGFMIMAYVMHTIGELWLSPIGLSMVSRLSPVRLGSVMMGVWLASSCLANFLAGALSSYASTHTISSVFMLLSIVPVILGLLLVCLNKPLLRLAHGRL